MSSPRPSASAAVEIGAIALMLAACEPIVFIARNPEGGATDDPCADAPAEWYFCSGFEEGDLAVAWDDFDGNPPATNQLLEDPGPHGASGNHVARLLPPPGAFIGADLVAELPTTSGPVWARWYAYWEPGFDLSIPNRGAGLHAGERELLGLSDVRPNGADRFDVLLGSNANGAAELSAYYAGMYQDCGAESCGTDHLPCTSGDIFCTRAGDTAPAPVPLATGRWICVELLVDPGDPTPSEEGADGVVDAWIDGVEVGPFPSRWMRASPSLAPSVLWMSVFLDAEHPEVGLRLDDVVVSRERVGC
jgi:hypothetical protein